MSATKKRAQVACRLTVVVPTLGLFFISCNNDYYAVVPLTTTVVQSMDGSSGEFCVMEATISS